MPHRWPWDWELILMGAVVALGICSFLDALQIARLQADVAFLRDVARNTDALRSDHE